MSWIAAVIIGAGAVIGGGASLLGAQKQAGAAGQATDAQLRMFGQTQQNLQPYMQSGTTNLRDLNFLMGVGPGGAAPQDTAEKGGYGSLAQPFDLSKFNASPAYKFNLQQGQQAIDKASSARGNYYAPQTLQDVGRFSQGLASNEFNNAYNQYNQNQQNIWNRLSGMANAGQSAAAGVSSAGVSTGQGIAGTIQGAGNAQAAGIVGAGNAVNAAGGQMYNNYLMQQILGQNQQSNYGPIQSGQIQSQWGYNPNTGLAVNPQQ